MVVRKLLLDQTLDCLVEGGNHLGQNAPLKTHSQGHARVLARDLGDTHLHAAVGGELREIILLCNLEEITVEGPLAKPAGSRVARSRRARAQKRAPALNLQ